MITNSPNWSSRTDIGQYPVNAFTKPNKPASKASLSLGPALIGDSQSKLNSRYWAVFQSGINVVLVGANGSSWGDEVVLFQEPLTIGDIGLTFDQLGRAMVFYQVGNNLYLFWYDPILEAQTVTLISTGSSLEAGFDIINNTSDPDSDAMIFYTRSNIVYMRIQRDRWGIEYPESIFLDDGLTPVTMLELVDSGMRVDNRFQVVYRYKDASYKPPDPIPPIVVPQAGYWKYKLTGYGSRISIEHNFWYDTKDDLTVSFIIDEVDLAKPDIVLFSQCFATHFVEQGSSQGRYGAQLLATVGGVNHDVLTLIIGGYKSVLPMPVKLQPGSWTFALSGGLMSISFTSLDNSNTVTLDNLSYAIGKNVEAAYVLIFGGDGSINPKNSFRGVMREMRASSMGRDIYCPGDDNSEIDGSYLPVYNADRTVKLYNARILNDYRNANWVFQPA